MYIETDRLSLSLMDESSQDDFFQLYQCPKVMRHIGETYSDDYLSRTFRNALLWNKHPSLKQKIWQIVEKNTADFVGIALVKKNSKYGLDFEVGIILSGAKSRKGFSVEAMEAVIFFIKKIQRNASFLGQVDCRNYPAAKSLLNLGFRKSISLGNNEIYELR